MDSNTLKALRVVVNESTTKQIKELQKDSDELEKIKEELPILFLTDKDKGHHGRGHFYYFIDENDENPDKCDALFRGRTSYGNFLFELVEHDNNHVIREMTYKEVVAMGFFQEPHMCGETGSFHGCVFGEWNMQVKQCGIWHPTISDNFDFEWKENGMEVLCLICNQCAQRIPWEACKEYIFDPNHDIFKCPHPGAPLS